MFEKKKLERILTRKTWDHAIDLREEFVSKKGKKISVIKNKEREGIRVCERLVEKGVY